MIKLTTLFILFFVIQCQASSRLLQSTCEPRQCEDPDGTCADMVSCLENPCNNDNGGCTGGQTCTANYCGGCNAICSCPSGQCFNPSSNTCEGQVFCIVEPCSVTDCGAGICNSNYCGGCNAICEGDVCGTIGVDCGGMRCPCWLCPDGVNSYGCSCDGNCHWNNDGNGNLVCSALTPRNSVCPLCGGFDNCAKYNDGCNDCICSDDGLEACTEMACKTLLTPRCVECKFPYRFDDNGDCVAKKECVRTNECSSSDGFHCREDPMCGTDPDYDVFCTEPPKVCVDIDGHCTSDDDCDVGFTCDGIGGGGFTVCVKYE